MKKNYNFEKSFANPPPTPAHLSKFISKGKKRETIIFQGWKRYEEAEEEE